PESTARRSRGATPRASAASAESGRGSMAAPRTRPSPAAPSSRKRPLEPETDLADLDHVALAERRHLGDGSAVHECPVRALEILDVPRAATEGQDRVLRRRELVVDDDRVVDVTTDRRDRIQRERVALG